MFLLLPGVFLRIDGNMTQPRKLRPETIIEQFERAVLRYDELGAIPIHSDDKNEQIAIDRTRTNIKRQYMRAYNQLLKALTKDSQ